MGHDENPGVACGPVSTARVTGGPVEVACDESGSEGEKLVGGTTDVFAHASVCLDVGTASSCITELRDRTRSPATEYKASVVLREQNRAALTWLLGPSGPIHARAHVHLTEKSFFVVVRIIELLVDGSTGPARWGVSPDQRADGLASELYQEGPVAFGRDAWLAFLAAFNDLMRAKGPADVTAYADTFFGLVDALRRAGSGSRAGDILELVWRAEADLDRLVARLLDTSQTALRLDPLVPAIVRAVDHWGRDGRPVSIVHDQQHALTAERIASLIARVDAPRPDVERTAPAGRLVGVRLVDSRSDPRVQVADLLAGSARRIASDGLNGRADAELIGLLRPYVDRHSIWGERRTGALLAGRQG